MRDLSMSPAFGWETANCNANKALEERAIKKFDKITDKLFNSDKGLLKGLPKCLKNRIINSGKDIVATASHNGHIVRNIGKVAEYLPVVSTVAGLVRVIDAATTSKKKLPNKNWHIARGAAAVLGFGFPGLLIADAIVTLQRGDKKASKHSSQAAAAA